MMEMLKKKMKKYEFLKRKLLSAILCHGTVLDIGCGEGTFSHQNYAVGIDIDVNRLRFCSYDSRVRADASHLPFKDKSFDVCIESACFSYVKNWKDALSEMCRVGKRCFLIEQIRNHKRLHWFSLLELNGFGTIIFFVLRTFVVKVRFNGYGECGEG
jgi:SAM-dependent methyltransferase